MSEGQVKLGFGLDQVYIPSIEVVDYLPERSQELIKFRDEVYATLHSQIQGFGSVCELMRAYNEDTGKDPYEVARNCGFNSFGDFLASDAMSDYVVLAQSGSGERSYHAAPREAFNHIRREQLISFNNVCQRRVQREGYFESARIRPKLFEVARVANWDTTFVDPNRTDCKPPNVLKLPSATATQRRNADCSVWRMDDSQEETNIGNNNGVDDDDDDNMLEEWGEKLCANVKPFPAVGMSERNFDWGYEEVSFSKNDAVDQAASTSYKGEKRVHFAPTPESSISHLSNNNDKLVEGGGIESDDFW